jgi:hypothetical protein
MSTAPIIENLYDDEPAYEGRRFVGYWKTAHCDGPGLVDPRECLDPEWDQRDAVADAIDRAPVLEQWMGWHDSLLTGQAVGSACCGIPGWAFPAGLSHYVRQGVRLPDEFVSALLVWVAANPDAPSRGPSDDTFCTPEPAAEFV